MEGTGEDTQFVFFVAKARVEGFQEKWSG